MTLDTRIWLHGTIKGEDAFALSLHALLKAAGHKTEVGTGHTRRYSAGELPEWVADVKPGDKMLNGSDWTEERIEMHRAKRDSISTVIGQGLPGIVDCDFRADGSPLAPEDVHEEFDSRWHDSPEEVTVEQRACQVQLSWDTAYSYNEGGMGCTELHARALVNLFQTLPAGVTMTWQNEFTGDVFAGLDGLVEFLGDGSSARSWFNNEAMPAILASMQSERARA